MAGEVAEQRQRGRARDGHLDELSDQVVAGDASRVHAREDDIEIADRAPVQHGVVALRRALNQHLVGAAVQLGVMFALVPELEIEQLNAARVLHRRRHVVGEIRGRRAGALRIHEDVGAVEADLVHERGGFAEVLVGFAREADDEVGEELHLGHARAGALDAGLGKIADGQQKVADGLPRAVDGSGQIADGLGAVIVGQTSVGKGIDDVRTKAVAVLNSQFTQGTTLARQQLAGLDAAAELVNTTPGAATTTYVLTQHQEDISSASASADSGGSNTGRNIGLAAGGALLLLGGIAGGFLSGRRAATGA